MSERAVDPILWGVMDQRLGAVDVVLLGDRATDSYRVGVTMVRGKNGPEVDAQVVYPCRVCGWESACGPGGEDCHS